MTGRRHLQSSDPDSTFTAHPPARPAATRPFWRRAAPAAALALTAAGLIALRIAWFPAAAPALPAVAPATASHAAAPAQTAPLADEAELLAAPADRLTIRRFRPAPAVLVLIFPSLHAQALTLNRIACFIEKAGAPHDRVLDDTALDAAIASNHDRFDTYYYGHDYRAADLARFFATAARQDLLLRPEEVALHDMLDDAGLLRPGIAAALISLPPPGAGVQDATGRAVILRHELSHGAYFTDPAYAAAVRGFWATALDAPARAGFRRFLGDGGYDTADEDLMRNEAQAYLVFTPDRRLFDPAAAGLSTAEASALRGRLVAAMPPGWLHELATP